MRNRLLSITRDSIPYVKELRPVAGSMAGCIIMQQLDYWFDRKPDGFYKFLEPCDHALYQPGDSWTEELGCTQSEFRTCFDKFGHRWKSKGEFDAAKDKFQGQMYCCYHDKIRGVTVYFRNHERMDALLDEIAERKSRELPPLVRNLELRSENFGVTYREIPSYVTPKLETESNRDYNRDYTENRQQQQPPAPSKPKAKGVVVASSASLAEEMVSHGVTKSVAAKLIETHGETVCRVQLDALPLRKCADPAATLVAAIREEWEIPQAKRPTPRPRSRTATRPAPPPAREPTEEQKEAARAAVATAKKSLGKAVAGG